MKKLFSISVFTLLIMGNAMAQANLKVSFKNNSVLPHKYTFVSYEPGKSGNGTVGKFLLPMQAVDFKLTEGTRIFLADSKQIDVVMSGQKLRSEPFYTALKTDNNKTINLR